MPSTVIRMFHYDADRKRLVIDFQSGRRYAYSNVPAEIYLGMCRARSRGSFFNTQVRDRYPYVLVEQHSGVRNWP
jgi:hypothetical protein